MNRIASNLPRGLVLYKATSVFTNETVPAALLRAHCVKAGTWGQLHVLRGRVRYCVDSEILHEVVVEQGAAVAIEPEVSHRIELLDADSEFRVEFYRPEAA